MGNFSSIASPLHDELGLKIGEMPICKVYTPVEMRQALMRMAYRYSPLLQQLYNRARIEGFSGEDMYVMFTFYLQLEYENMHERLFSLASRSLDAPPLFVVKKGGPYDPADTMKR